MLLASPVATVGPLHDLDPVQGISIDLTVAAIGTVAIASTILALTFGNSSTRHDTARSFSTPTPWLTNVVRGTGRRRRADPRHARRERGHAWRPLAASTAATALLAMCATFVPSAVALSETPSHYGFDADVIALNAYGDQSADELARRSAANDGVVAATGFTLTSLLVDGHAVPGLAATAVKGELTPTILEGRPARADDEIVVGRDTLDSLDATSATSCPCSWRHRGAQGDRRRARSTCGSSASPRSRL